MFIEPASKVLVPPTVVMRTRSSVADRVLSPHIKQESLLGDVVLAVIPDIAHIFPEMFVKTICAAYVEAAIITV